MEEWIEVDYIILTMMNAEECVFNVSCTEILSPEPSCRSEGLEMLKSLPAGYRPEFVGLFPCVLRGTNMYATRNVESRGFEKVLGQRVPILAPIVRLLGHLSC
eukprot:3912178-Amphidinium_carterae.1